MWAPTVGICFLLLFAHSCTHVHTRVLLFCVLFCRQNQLFGDTHAFFEIVYLTYSKPLKLPTQVRAQTYLFVAAAAAGASAAAAATAVTICICLLVTRARGPRC